MPDLVADVTIDSSVRHSMAVCDGCQLLRLIDLDSADAADWLNNQRQSASAVLPDAKWVVSIYAEIGEAFDVDTRSVGFWRRQGAPITPRAKNDLTEIRLWRIEYLQSKSMAAGTSNHYAPALRDFVRWLVKRSKRITYSGNLLGIEFARKIANCVRRSLDGGVFGGTLASPSVSREWSLAGQEVFELEALYICVDVGSS